MSAYDDAVARFLVDSANPPRILQPSPGVPIAQSRPAPVNVTSTGIYQPLETQNIDGIITKTDALVGAVP